MTRRTSVRVHPRRHADGSSGATRVPMSLSNGDVFKDRCVLPALARVCEERARLDG